MKKHTSQKPHFLYFASQDTHGPADVPPCYTAPYDKSIPDNLRRILAGKLSSLDSAIGNITQAYKSNGMWDNLLIVYVADNGGPIVVASGPNKGNQEDAIGASNWPLRGGKHNAYEGGVRVTAFISGPYLDKLQARAGAATAAAANGTQRTYSGLMHAVDWLPTLCAVAGCTPVPHTPGMAIDGVNQLSSILQNASSPRDRVIIDMEDPTGTKWPDIGSGAVRIGKYKLHIGDAGQFSRPGDWSPQDAWLNVSATEPSTYTGYQSVACWPFPTHYSLPLMFILAPTHTGTNCLMWRATPKSAWISSTTPLLHPLLRRCSSGMPRRGRLRTIRKTWAPRASPSMCTAPTRLPRTPLSGSRGSDPKCFLCSARKIYSQASSLSLSLSLSLSSLWWWEEGRGPHARCVGSQQ